MRQRSYTEKEYNLAIKLCKQEKSPCEILELSKKRYGLDMALGAIKYWIYDNGIPPVVKETNRLRRGYENLTSDKAYILGVLCGDGWVDAVHKPRVGLGCTSKEFIDEFKSAFKRHYGINPSSLWLVPKEKIRESYVALPIPHLIKAKKDQIHLYFYGRELLRDITRYGNFKTRNWRVPPQIMKSDNPKIICSFLKGLYDSEGNANYHVCLSSRSLKGLKDVKRLLEKIGVELFSIAIRKNSTCFVLLIHNQNGKRTFQKYVGFRIPHRQRQLEKNLAKYKTRESYSQKRVKSLVPEIIDLRKKGFSSRKIAKRFGVGKTTVLRVLHKYDVV